jgi:hypothetical protein
MDDTHTITPHILSRARDGRVLCLPMDDDGREVIAVFANRTVAEDVAPEGYRPVYCGHEKIEKLSEALEVPLVALLGLGDDPLDGSVFTAEAFVGVLTGEWGDDESAL